MRTPKGTEIPLLNLRGKDYLEVKNRLIWFREEKPDWSIETEAVSVTDLAAYFKATIKDEQGRIRSTAHKFESKQGFPDFIEKAETGSIGRALALVGYGTQFCADELDEGERIVDAPVARKVSPSFEDDPKLDDPISFPQPKKSPTSIKLPFHGDENFDEPGTFRFTFGEFRGKRLDEVDIYRLDSYAKWLQSKTGTFTGRLRAEVPALIKIIEKFLKSRETTGGIKR